MAIDRARNTGEPDIEEVLDDLTLRIERLRVLYEQYFMGIEKMEPHTARKEVARKTLELQQLNIRNTGLRYRFNTLVQKLSVYTTYWNRTLRAIENGTYYRDVARVGRQAVQRGKDVPDEVLRAMPERLRAKIMKEREQLAARQARTAKLNADAAAADDPSRTQPNLPTVSGLAELSGLLDDDDHSDIDSALDNLFGDAEAAVLNVAPPRQTSPPPMQTPRAATPPPVQAPRSTTPPPVQAPRSTTPPPVQAPRSTTPPPVQAPRSTTPPPLPRTTTPPPVPAAAKTPPPMPRTTTPPPVPAAARTPPPMPRTTTPPPAAARTPPPEVRTPTPVLKTPTPTPLPPGAGLPPGVDESAARDLHKKYVQAKRLLGENTDNIKYEHIVATIAKQAPAIMKQHQARSVEFQVVIKDDKVILKATPKK